MKKLLNILSTTIIVSSTAATVVACSAEMNSNVYKDTELNNIKDKSLIKYIEASSMVAKNFIAGRHENANYSATSFARIFGNYSAPLVAPDGQKIDLSNAINDLHDLNPVLQNRDPIKDMSRAAKTYFEFSADYESEGYDPNNTIWSLYDMGPLINTSLTKGNSKTARDLLFKRDFSEEPGGTFSQYHNGAGYMASHLLQGSNKIDGKLTPIYDRDSKDYNLKFEKGDQEVISFGKNMGATESGNHNIVGISALDVFRTGLETFGKGTEEFALASLSSSLPIINIGRTSDLFARDFFNTYGTLLFLNSNFGVWFNEDGTINHEGILANSSIKFDDTTHEQEKRVFEIINTLTTELLPYYMEDAKKPVEEQVGFPLDGSSNEVRKAFRLIREMAAIFGDLTSNSPDFDGNIFNSKMSEISSKMLELLLPIIGKDVSVQIETLMEILGEVFMQGKFPAREFARFLGDTSALFTDVTDNGDGTYKVVDKEKNYKAISNVYNFSKGKTEQQLKDEGYTTNINKLNKSWTDKEGKYFRTIMNSFGLQNQEQEQYDEGSIFKWIENMQQPSKDGPNSGGYDLIQALFYDNSNPFTKIFKEGNESITNNWIDKIFLDQTWNITANGIGANGERLGWNKDRNAVTYQLDYYGPKDASVDLSTHENKINYLNKDEKYLEDVPQQLQDLSFEDQVKYDGLGNEYLENSDQVKYSYVVTYENINSDSKIEQQWKFTDFEWFYNNKRYY